MRLVIIDDVEASRNSISARIGEREVDVVSLDLAADVETLADRIGETVPDCVLLDFVLTGSGRVRYRSHVLARVLRDRAIDGTGPDVPLALYSSAPNFKQFYDADQTSHELYDYRFDKDSIQANIDAAVQILRALSAAYKSLSSTTRDRAALIDALEHPKDVELDPRIGNRFTSIVGTYPSSELVGYLVREIIEQPHPLVDTSLLAARLGLDIDKSPGLPALLEELPRESSYQGICSMGFKRWWWQIVEIWLDSLGKRSFRTLSAGERVDVLRSNTNVTDLEAATPICENYQTSYWSVCEAYHRPVDLADAFIASNGSREPWHDHRYISVDAALRHAGEALGVVVDAVDEERYAQVRQLLGG